MEIVIGILIIILLVQGFITSLFFYEISSEKNIYDFDTNFFIPIIGFVPIIGIIFVYVILFSEKVECKICDKKISINKKICNTCKERY